MNGRNFKDEALCTCDGFREELVYQGHVRFALDGIRYFAFPQGAHSYGVCLWSDMTTGGHARWSFDSEDALMQAKLFGGKSLTERISEIETYSESTPFA